MTDLKGYLDQWKQHMTLLLNHACPICSGLQLTPTWGEPMLFEQRPAHNQYGGTFTTADLTAIFVVRLVCQAHGFAAHFDARTVGVYPGAVAQGLRDKWPKVS